MTVWLSSDEINDLLGATDDQQRIALALGTWCGLRSHEVLDVAPEDVHDTDAGTILRVHHGKGDTYRETPVPRDLATNIRAADQWRDAPPSAPLIDITSTRTLRRWVGRAAEQLEEETGDLAWRHLRFHDLRRTWVTSLASADVDALLVCDWGGWSVLQTFLDHYRGTYSPEAQKRERGKVEWL